MTTQQTVVVGDHEVTVNFLTRSDLSEDAVDTINGACARADRSSLDTETVYDQTLVPVPDAIIGSAKVLRRVTVDVDGVAHIKAGDMVTGVTYQGQPGCWVRDLNVDGPGPSRVISIAARYGDTIDCWVIDTAGVDDRVLQRMLTGLHMWGWNTRFDDRVLRNHGVTDLTWSDAMIADSTLRAGAATGVYRSLAAAAKAYVKVTLDGKDTTRVSYDVSTPLTGEQVRYAASDAIVTVLVADLICGRAQRVNLMDTITADMAGKPVIDAFVSNGFPIDRVGYIDEQVEPAKLAAARAGERLAYATTASQVVSIVASWARAHQVHDSDADDQTLTRIVMASPTLWDPFMEYVLGQETVLADAVAVAAGGSLSVPTLFSENKTPRVVCPFPIGDDSRVRKWISETYPLFARAVVAASINPHMSVDDIEAAACEHERFHALANGGQRILVKHDLDSFVLPWMQRTPLVGAHGNTFASALREYRALNKFIASYGVLTAPVHVKPDWNVNSAPAVKTILNTYATARVKDYFTKLEGTARLLSKTDSVDGDALKMIGGEIASTILEYRKYDKIVSTYGVELLDHVHPATGRIHANYKQGLTGTGRLSSENPNAQNLPPASKPYIRPLQPRRVLVCGDLSQAELRFGADQSGDRNMLAAFASGEDLHERTASLMFGVDMKYLSCIKTGAHLPVSEDQQATAKAKQLLDEALGELVDEATREQLSEKSLMDADWDGEYARVHATVAEQLTARAAAGKVYKGLRHKAKRVAFGYAYGLGARRLADSLTIEGVPTTTEEAAELIKAFDRAYPQFAAWMAARVATIKEIASNLASGRDDTIDFDSAWKHHMLLVKVKEVKPKAGSDADPLTLSTLMASDEDLRASGISRQQHAADVAWAVDTEPFLHTRQGHSWAFTSTTAGGRIRWFPIRLADWEQGMVNAILRSRDPRVKAAASQWAITRTDYEAGVAAQTRASGKTAHDPAPIALFTSNGPIFGDVLKKTFEDRSRRTDLVRTVLQAAPDKATALFRAGAADRVSAAVNQFRNQPIQGGVADAMVNTFRLLAGQLQAFPTALPIQSVHDSLVIECDVEDARAIQAVLKSVMEEGMRQYCPVVTLKADVDIQLSLDDKTIISDEKLTELMAA